jgi:hypothetical protein
MSRPAIFTAIVLAAWCGLALASWAAPAVAQQAQCGPYADVTALVAGDPYREAKLGVGDSNTASVELWVNPETGTWTLLALSPDGSSACLAGSGVNWQFADARTGEPL